MFFRYYNGRINVIFYFLFIYKFLFINGYEFIYYISTYSLTYKITMRYTKLVWKNLI